MAKIRSLEVEQKAEKLANLLLKSLAGAPREERNKRLIAFKQAALTSLASRAKSSKRVEIRQNRRSIRKRA